VNIRYRRGDYFDWRFPPEEFLDWLHIYEAIVARMGPEFFGRTMSDLRRAAMEDG